MGKNLFLYSITNKYYYEDILYKDTSNEFKDIVEDVLPYEWKIEKMSMFYSCKCEKNNLLPQGWKIHVSSNLNNCKNILRSVAKVAVESNTVFKFMRDTSILRLSSEKIYPKEGSGKFITLYPESTEKFLWILEALYKKLKKYEGPYILSDKRYKDCSVLYYRYGGFKSNYRINAEGMNIPTLKDIDGSVIDDIRKPYFEIPISISDPVEQICSEEEDSYLHENYLIRDVLYSSNSGGVYRATRKSDKENVIIKEARPYTCMVNRNIDSIDLREKEYRMLKMLEQYDIAPRPIEIFKDWEHIFLVEEYVEGIDFQQFSAQNNVFYKNFEDDSQLDKYIKNILKIFIKIVNILEIIHKNGFVVTDLSPKNVLVTDELKVKIIDLEACLAVDEKDICQLSTSGYSEKMSSGNLIKSDLYSLGCVFFSSLINRNEMIKIDSDVINRTLDSLYMDYSLPEDLKNIILELMDKRIDNRPELGNIKYRLENLIARKENYKRVHRKKDYSELNIKYKKIIDDCVECIDKISTVYRNDRLFPNMPLINNPLNITNGALGNIYAFEKLNYSDKTNKYKEWILNKLERMDLYPPGLYVGISGIAWVLLEMGEVEKAKKVISKCENNSLFNNMYGLRTGLAGYGIALLKFWIKTNDTKYLNMAKKVGDRLIREAKLDTSNNTLYWADSEINNKIGYGDGSSGISIFFLYLHIASKDNVYLEIGQSALEHDLLQKKQLRECSYYSFPSDNKNAKILYPYFMKGNAGVLSALIRYYKLTKDKKYYEEIESILPAVHVKHSINPGLFLGLAGLGNIMLDCHYILGDDSYLDMAYNIAEGIDLFKVKYDEGILFPGDYASKLSTDFGSGTSGIILYLNRLINKGDNFCFFLDELFDR